jgi:adenine-specific DNA-methyltransferase
VSTSELIFGDSTVLTDTIDGPIHCFITDPPYGMGYQSERAVTPDGKKYTKEIDNDQDEAAAIGTFMSAMLPMIPKTADDADMYVFCRWSMLEAWKEAVNALEPFSVHNVLIWDKVQLAMGDIWANWDYSFEFIIYAKKGRRLLPKRRSSILTFERVHAKHYIHPTEKPVPLIEELIRMSTSPGELIVDPFAGSGSTLVAAERLGRRAIGIEKDPDYYRRTSARLQASSNLLPLDV